MSSTSGTATVPAAAYGFTVEGVAGRVLQPATDAGRPLMRVQVRAARGSAPEQVTRTIPLVGGGRLLLERAARTAIFEFARPVAEDEIAHPYLGVAASVMAGWEGWDSLHAGAFVLPGGRALAVLGAREDGKSTLMAALALAGVPVLTDDVLILERGVAHVGPRSVDLRPGTEALLSSAELERSRSGERLRLALPPVAACAPLAGWVALEWGAQVELRALRPAHRLHRLARAHSRAGDPADAALLELARLPGWVLTRPRGARWLPAVTGRLLELG
ncbi:unannotated protein [freshwater metagenome]|uniref:Unannotated protein n=1 Tax=freshwater metagenome TaxID=449393 RepID=A0A6J7ITJ0_9ZZZZ|nr:hypothetical protein [Actinomycetota bacterium]